MLKIFQNLIISIFWVMILILKIFQNFQPYYPSSTAQSRQKQIRLHCNVARVNFWLAYQMVQILVNVYNSDSEKFLKNGISAQLQISGSKVQSWNFETFDVCVLKTYLYKEWFCVNFYLQSFRREELGRSYDAAFVDGDDVSVESALPWTFRRFDVEIHAKTQLGTRTFYK